MERFLFLESFVCLKAWGGGRLKTFKPRKLEAKKEGGRGREEKTTFSSKTSYKH